jgi:tetratricopeptide (TPR) repeat protein
MEEDKTDSEFNLLAIRCNELLDSGDIEGAIASVSILQANLQSAPDALSTLQKAQVSCLLVDVGASSRDETMVRAGLGLLEQNYAAFSEAIHSSSLEYNLGNAKKSLYDIAVLEHQERFRPEAIELLTEAKGHYWRALKLTGSMIPSPELLVNLANALDQCGRVVEALMWYNRALTVDPAFGMAHLNRGLALLFLNSLSDTYSIRLLDEARQCFRLAETSGQLPRELLEQAQAWWKSLNQSLLKLGYHNEKIQEAERLHAEEYQSHDPYWQWCLENYLVLSEHSLYCRCAGARRDDLAIPKQASPIGGEFVPKLELLLNRIKSEFCLARALYYQGFTASSEICWDPGPFEGTYTELYEGEDIGIRMEFLRTSFRLCFGVLDKVARGIADLFKLAPTPEALYFESFWRPVRERKKGDERRWGLINRQENPALVALFSLATDLNRAGGEWGQFKEDRNQLEHGLFLVRKNNAASIGSSGIVDLAGVDTVSATEFTERTFRMLQFTVSAVFSFAFCARIQGVKKLDLEGLNVWLDKKTGVGKP